MTAGRVDADYLHELFSAFGAVAIRRMFGGAGVFADGLMIALVTGGIIHLKTDEQTRADFEVEGCAPFSYAAKGERRVLTSFWRMPERLYDDPDELARWSANALAAARRGASPTRRSAVRRDGAKRP